MYARRVVLHVLLAVRGPGWRSLFCEQARLRGGDRHGGNEREYSLHGEVVPLCCCVVIMISF